MPQIRLPRASWEVIIDMIDNSDSPMKFALYAEMWKQLDEQEY